MKLLLSSFVLALVLCSLSTGQSVLTLNVVNTGTLQTGFAVITPTTGTGEGLSVSEIFGEQIAGNFFQAAVIASPLVTLTDVVINADSTTGLNTGIAIANPNASTATVTLSLRDQQGGILAARTITIGSHQQLSRFVTELFLDDPAFAQPASGLLFISSDLPLGVVALAINGNSFTALPVAAQLSGNNVITVAVPSPATVTTSTTATFNGVTVTTVAPTFSAPSTPTFNGVTTPPTILPIPSTILPAPPTVLPVTGTVASVVTSTGQMTGGLFGIPQTTSTISTGTPSVAPLSPVFFPQLTPGIGGPGAVLLPQLATGGGWVTQITIANTAVFTQTVRVDLFNPTGAPLSVPSGSTMSDIVIPPGGVATLRL